VPVVADPLRVRALRAWLPDHPDIDCIILDDGFQHRRAARDLDLVLIDAERPALRDRMLPAGHLREPPAALGRADAVVVTRADEVQADLASLIERHHGRPPIAWSRHMWPEVHVFDPKDGEQSEPIEWLQGRRVVTMLGVGHPESIERQLQRAGARLVAAVPASDHEHYTRATIAMARGMCEGADALVTTGKDWVKIRRLLDWRKWPSPIIVPRLRVDVFDGADALRALVRRVVRGEA
jgi:tetraacyldisaccharide 4'-kinase